MKFKSMLFILTICVSSVIHYVTSEAILGLATQGETLGNTTLDLENSQCCCSSTTTYQVGTQQVNWYQAYVLCRQNGMELASIASSDEEDALENYTKTIGAKRLKTQGQTLTNGTLESGLDTQGQTLRNGTLESGPETRWQTFWNTTLESAYYMDQISKNSSIMPPITQPIGVCEFSQQENCQCTPCCSSTSRTYLVVMEKVNWYQAYVLCKQYGMELASITSTNEENALKKYTNTISVKPDPYEGYWLAGTRYGSANSEFVWFTTGKPVIYRKFSANQPDNYLENEACLHLFLSAPNTFLWNDFDCNKKCGFICQSSKACI